MGNNAQLLDRDNLMNEKIIVGWVGIKNETPGTVQVCKNCATASIQELNAHSYGAVFSDDVYITHNGGMTCIICQARFI